MSTIIRIGFFAVVSALISSSVLAQESTSSNKTNNDRQITILQGYAIGFDKAYIGALKEGVRGLTMQAMSGRNATKQMASSMTDRICLSAREFRAEVGADEFSAPLISAHDAGLQDGALAGCEDLFNLNQLARRGYSPDLQSLEEQRSTKAKSAVYAYADRIGVDSSDAYNVLSRLYPNR